MAGFLSGLLSGGGGGIFNAIKDVAKGAISDLASGKISSLGDVGKSLLSHGVQSLSKNFLGNNAADQPAAAAAQKGIEMSNNAADHRMTASHAQSGHNLSRALVHGKKEKEEVLPEEEEEEEEVIRIPKKKKHAKLLKSIRHRR